MTATAGRLQRLREWLPVLPLLLLLAATYWLDQQVHPLLPASDGGKRHDPDFIVSRFAATTLDRNGMPHFILTAQKMTHYPDNDSTYLDEPRLDTLFADHPPLYASARQGEISSRGTDVYMHGDVKLVRAASDMQNEMTFTTSYLHAVPDLGLMDTNRPVVLSDDHNVTHAVGMKFDNRARKITLLAQVRSEHEVTRP